MIDRNAAMLAGLICAICAADIFLNDANALMFLLKKMFVLMAYIEFWH